MYRTQSYDSQNRPLTDVHYQQAHNPGYGQPYQQPYGAGGDQGYAQKPEPQNQYYNEANAPYYNESTPYLATTLPARKKGKSKWLTVGVPILVVLIAAAVVGVILGIRAHNKSSPKSGGSGSGGSPASGGGPATGTINTLAIWPTATDSYFLPVYPSAVRWRPPRAHQITN